MKETILNQEEPKEFVLIETQSNGLLKFLGVNNLPEYTIANAMRFKSLEETRKYIIEKGLKEEMFFPAPFEESRKLSEDIIAKRHKNKMEEFTRIANNLTPNDISDLANQLDKLVGNGNKKRNNEIPNEIKCPDCKGEGQYYEGDELSQCELCSGEGTIILKEYAKDRSLTVEEAYNELKSDNAEE